MSRKGYCQLIGSLQYLHFALKIRNENNGMLSYHASLWLHLGHFDGGKTIDSFEKGLNITTLKKLPNIKPKIKIYEIIKI